MPSSTATKAIQPSKDDLLKQFVNIQIDNEHHIVRNVAPKKTNHKFQTIAENLAVYMEQMAKTDTIGLV